MTGTGRGALHGARPGRLLAADLRPSAPALALLTALWLLAPPISVRAQQAAVVPGHRTARPAIESLQAGFAGRFRVGYWAPFNVTVRAGAEPIECVVELTLADCDGVPSRVTAPALRTLSIPAQGQASVQFCAKVGQRQGPVTLALRNGETLLASRAFAPGDESLAGILPSNRGLLLALGAPLVAADKPMLEQRQYAVADVEDLGELPDDWWGYDGIDTVLLATHDPEFVASLLAAPAKIAALAQWVRMGGRLVLSVGKSAEQTLADDSPLVELTPGALDGLVPLRQSTPWESYTETSETLDFGPGVALQVPRLQNVAGRIEAYAGSAPRDLPLVVRSPLGFGEVTLLAFDLAETPFAAWRARPQLLDRVLRRNATLDSGKTSGAIGQVTTLGFEDLTGQLRGALEQFVGVALAPFWLVALLVFGYVLCIGPVDYFIVRRVLGRMEATWFTFSATVVVFCVGAYILAYRLKGDQLRINRVDVVDFDVEAQWVRGTSWMGMFSPQTNTYNLDLQLDPLVAQTAAGNPPSDPPESSSGLLLSWLGLPGPGFGGMDSASSASPLGGDSLSGGAMFNEPYDYTRRFDGLRRMPIAVWSSKTLVGRWWCRGAAAIDAQLTDKGRLAGSLHNQLGSDVPDGLLLYDRWAFPIREWRNGQTLDLQLDLDQQTVETYLRHVATQGDRNVTPPYDRASFDIRRIVEMLSAHELAGGAKYTGLAHEYQGFFDMSRLVANRRAVLLVRVDRQATVLKRDGQPLGSQDDRWWTFYRYVFEVETE